MTTSANPPLIQLHDAGVAYSAISGFLKRRKIWALHDLSMSVNPGETLGIVGRNGAGKSSLLRLLAGVYKPDAGRIVYATRRVSLLGLRSGVSPNLTGKENALLNCVMLGLSVSQGRQRLRSIEQFTDIGAYFHRQVRTYSSGMRARLGFSIAIHACPDVMLIDEVLGVGDAEFREKSGAAIRQHIASGRTAVIVTHFAPIIEKICDRCLWLDRGRIRAAGKPREVLAKYHRAWNPQTRQKRLAS